MSTQKISIQVGGNRKTQSWKDYCKDGKDWKCYTLDGNKDFSDQLDEFEDNRDFRTTRSIRSDLKDVWEGLGKNKKDKDKDKDKDKSPDPITKVDQPPAYVGKNAAGQGLTQAEWDLYSGSTLMTLQGEINKDLQDSINSTSLAIQNLQNEASAYGYDTQEAINIYSQDAASWRTQYTTDAQERWENFSTAMGYKATTDAAKITGAYNVELTKIMKAGDAEVSKINGEYANAGKRITGEYGLAGERIRSAAARDVAQRNKEAAMFGSFLGGFWN